MKCIIRDREAGNVIETVNTREEAESIIEQYEYEDREEGSYTPDFYEIVEECSIEEKILRACGHMTEADIQRHLKIGIIYYETYEDYYADCIAGGCDPEDIPEMWNRMDVSTVDGIVYHFECIL